MKPENWPKSFTYSPTNVVRGIHPNLFFRMITSSNPEDLVKRSRCIEEERVHPHLKIQKLTAPHPLAKGRKMQHGLFATHKIPKDTEIGPYIGEIGFCLDEIKQRKGVYIWELSLFRQKIFLYSGTIANELTFVNDFRGIQKEPNLRTRWIIHQGVYYLGYETSKEIQPKEELLVDYGPIWANLWEKNYKN